MPLTPEFLTFEGLRVRVARSRTDGAPTVLLLSPMPESIYAFLPNWAKLAQKFDLIAIDLPGFGQSEGKPELLTPRAMGGFVVRLASHLGVQHAHGIGPDVGTSTLLSAVADHPGFFHSLVVGSGATSYPLKVGSLLKDFIAAPSAEEFGHLNVRELVESLFADVKTYEPPQHVLDDYIASYSNGRFAESMAYIRSYPETLPRVAALLPDLRTPVQNVAGRHDPFVLLGNAEDLHRRLPRSRLTVLDCGHFPWEEEHAVYADILEQWLNGGYASV